MALGASCPEALSTSSATQRSLSFKKAYPRSFAATEAGLRVSAASVRKSHHTGFAPTKQNGTEKPGNGKASLLAERSIAEPRCAEFYLAVHTASKGTARPIHVSVVWDEVAGHLRRKRASGLPTKATLSTI